MPLKATSKNKHELDQNKDIKDTHGIRKTQAKPGWHFTHNHSTPLHNSAHPMQGDCFCNQVAQTTEEWSKFQSKVYQNMLPVS